MTAPIDPQSYVNGTNVVDIGDVRVARGMSRRAERMCRHKNLVYDLAERRVWCRDCESNVEPFDAFVGLVEQWALFERKLAELRKLQDETLVSRAAKRMDKAWRSRTTVPLCPHCNTPIFARDILRYTASMSREIAEARRAAMPNGEGKHHAR